jgi:protein-S-isoprenylcysteine O-methyltransferase Ste14
MFMILRAAVAFAALPGIVAIALPFCWLTLQGQLQPLFAPGLLLLAMGLLCLLICVREFLVFGQGTLAPWDPPRKLVRTGLYRYTRNPMYVSVLLVLFGWASAYLSWPLLIYTVALAAMFHLSLLLQEEPCLKRTYGEQWLEYAQRVPRWLLN